MKKSQYTSRTFQVSAGDVEAKRNVQAGVNRPVRRNERECILRLLLLIFL